ncbi:MAG TPA: nucleotide exchange factor GrpE [Clostridiales bacterium]|nr:nucleotide exchange factor GrpE [Clostridiales bacterium]
MQEELKELNEKKETAESNLEATQEELRESQEEKSLDDYKEMIEKLQQEKEELHNQYLRLAADFQNYKRRNEKEKNDIYEFANEKLILELLPIIDNFERALQSVKESEENKKFVEGVEMIFKQLLAVLNKNGVQEIDAMGKAFDPNYHHAVMQEENPDYESNTIIEVLQKGYTFREKVIRPSMVKVAN